MPQLPDILSYDELGGNKQNYAPVEDIATDRDASEVNNAFCAVAEMSATSVQTWLNISLGTDPQIADGYISWQAQWKTATPTPPVITRMGVGIINIEFPAEVQDAKLEGDLHTLSFNTVQTSFLNTRGFIETIIMAGNQLQISLYDTSDTPSDFTSGDVLVVWIM